MAVRGALGASAMGSGAGRLIAESLLLSFVGGALGLVGAFVGLRMLAQLPEEAQLPRMDRSSSMAACCCSRP